MQNIIEDCLGRPLPIGQGTERLQDSAHWMCEEKKEGKAQSFKIIRKIMPQKSAFGMCFIFDSTRDLSVGL